jgi:hypothetical protein
LNIAAVFEPSNSFTIGAVTRNRKRGTAIVTVDVPNPGELTASGKGVKAASAPASPSKSVPAGAAQLLIKAKGIKKRNLVRNGRVKVTPKIRYTPTGGTSRAQTLKLKLIRR